jgi:hypothetical protein
MKTYDAKEGTAGTVLLVLATAPDGVQQLVLSNSRFIHGKIPQYSSDGRLDGPQCWYGRCGGNKHFPVRFEVFTAVTMKNAVFWNVTLCGSCNNRRFGGS